MSQVTYGCARHAYVANPPGVHGHATPRPWVEVEVSYNGWTHRVWCLVDTGADDTILDLGTAFALNVVAGLLPQSLITMGNGVAVGYGLLVGATLDFAGTRVPAPGGVGVPVLLGPVAVPLLGRSALLQAAGSLTDVGFDAMQWLHS